MATGGPVIGGPARRWEASCKGPVFASAQGEAGWTRLRRRSHIVTSVGYVGTIDDTRSFEWLSSRYPDSFQVTQDDVRTSCLGQKGFWLELDNGKRMEFLFTDPHRDAELGADLLVGALESKLEIGPGVDLSRRR